MTLEVTQIPYDTEFPLLVPIKGCGLIYKLEESDFQISAGAASVISISFGFSAALSNGDSFVIHGIEFTFTTGIEENARQINIPDSVSSFKNVIDRIPKIRDNYDTVIGASNSITFTNKKAKLDEDFEFSANVTNTGAIEVTPLSTPDQGTNAVIKDEYQVLADVFDTSGKKVCSDPLDLPLNVFADGVTNSVCFDFQSIISNLPDVYSTTPSPKHPNPPFANRPIGLETNFTGTFVLWFYGYYKDPNSSDDCARDLFYIDGATLGVANVLQKKTYQGSNFWIDQFSFGGILSGAKELITIHPEEYKICKKTPFEFRWDCQNGFINSIGGDNFLQVLINYSDGTVQNLIIGASNTDGVQIGYISLFFDDAPYNNETIFVDFPEKQIDSITVRPYYNLLGFDYVVAEKTYYIDNDPASKCCSDCAKYFYFLSCVGNNEVLISKCKTDIDVDIEFLEVCKTCDCGGEDLNGIPQYLGGKISEDINTKEKVYKVFFEAPAEYLEEFISSPVKYVYEDNSIYRITPVSKSYKIYKKNLRNLLEFTYRKSLVTTNQYLKK